MAWKEAESNYTQGERWFILHDYLRRNSRKGHPVSRSQVLDYLSLQYDISITPRTFYADIAVLSGGAFGLQVVFDKNAFRGDSSMYRTCKKMLPHTQKMYDDAH